MRNNNTDKFSLVPETGIRIVDGKTVATSLPFFLRLKSVELVNACRWVRIRYSSSFFDEPVRPLIRFVTARGKIFVQPMNGPVLGSAEWVGRVPDQTILVSISPGRRLGPFSFRIDSIRPISRRALMRHALGTEPSWTFWAIRSRWVNSREEAWQALKYAVAGTPLEQYGKWRARFIRDLDLEGLDKPRADWSVTPHIHLFMSLGSNELTTFQNTLNSLKAQIYRRWSLHIALDRAASAKLVASVRREIGADGRLSELDPSATGSLNFYENDRLAVIGSGDTLPDEALAVIAETLAMKPNLALVYSDQDSAGPRNDFHTPIFKPDWSPIFNEQSRYVGRLTCIRYAELAAFGFDGPGILANEDNVVRTILAKTKPELIGRIPRVLYHGHGKTTQSNKAPTFAPRPAAAEPDWPDVTIVIPTRDRADLLAACVRGIKEKTDYSLLRIVIVDNESTQRDARALLAQLATDPRFTVLERPGPFNYSKLSNAGARATNTRLLVFMNNDVQILDSNWLKGLVRWAIKPQAGAVGAKLLFPHGRIQHAGVVLGMGGISGHVYRRSRSTEPGYLHQLHTTREVLAVTGACFAIERNKFEAAGGFEEENLPVDLNDIDLCLRLAESGWTNLWTPDATLIHLQSASRGVDRDPFETYRRERNYFMTRWAEAIRDDPYFHPGFSLFSQAPMLA
jgi:GT2 family glycosyltransferase